VEFQFELIRQQILKHHVEIVKAVGMVRLGLNIPKGRYRASPGRP
jgi:hypothetical protein